MTTTTTVPPAATPTIPPVPVPATAVAAATAAATAAAAQSLPTTQEELDKLITERAARATREGKKAAEDALKAKLGDRTLDAVLAAADSVKAAEDALKTEAQRDREAAATDKAEAASLKAEAAAELHATRVQSALIGAGVPEAGVSAIVVPGLTVVSTPEDIKAAVETLKTALPALFATQAIPPSDPGKGPGRPPAGGEFGAGGKTEFDKRYPKPTT